MQSNRQTQLNEFWTTKFIFQLNVKNPNKQFENWRISKTQIRLYYIISIYHDEFHKIKKQILYEHNKLI